MQRIRNVIAGGLAVAAAATVIVAPAQASTPNGCSYDPNTQVASYTLAPGGGGAMEIALDGQNLAFFDAFGEGLCPSPTGQLANRSNTASIRFSGTRGADDFIVSERGGTFFGGASGGADPQQMEIAVDSGANDTVDVVGTEGVDMIAITGGSGTGKQGAVSLDPFIHFPGVKLTSDPALLRVNGAGGGDVITGRSIIGPTSLHLDLSGGAGNDELTDGLLAGDHLQGNEGDDKFNTKDGQPGDNVTGGTGVDTASIDSIDQAFQVEKFH
jgi:hypothetical protein